MAAAVEDVYALFPAEELQFWQGVGWLHDVLDLAMSRRDGP
ncbi:MAG: hypothetical protein ABIE42_09705 [Candidatus Eisenbacteria bacterium]